MNVLVIANNTAVATSSGQTVIEHGVDRGLDIDEVLGK